MVGLAGFTGKLQAHIFTLGSSRYYFLVSISILAKLLIRNRLLRLRSSFSVLLKSNSKSFRYG